MPEEIDPREYVRRLPEREALEEILSGDPVGQLLGVARDRAIIDIGFDVSARPETEQAEVEAALSKAVQAARKVAEKGEAAQLSEEEREALELFLLLVTRPALFVQRGTVRDRPENWPEIRRDAQLLPLMIAGAGRLEDSDGDGKGSGFIVGDRRVMTNNHVVCALLNRPLTFFQTNPDDYRSDCERASEQWSGDRPRPGFEMLRELGSSETRRTEVLRILAHHGEVDMAILELAAMPQGARRLELADAAPDTVDGRRVYLVGYPMEKPSIRVTPAAIFQRIFGDDQSLGTKRFSPGTVMEWKGGNVFRHDASTLGGSSGSCIVDFEESRVIGLHFSGAYRKRNNAVPLWKFHNDPLLVDNGVVFGG